MIYRIRIMRLENGVLVFDRYATEMNLLDLRVSTDGKVEKLVRCKWLESEAERHELLQKPTTVVLGYHNNACHNLIYAEWIDVSATHFVEWGEDVDALRSRIEELEKQTIVWHRYPDEKPELGKTYNVTCYHESCAINKYRVIHGVIYSNENDNEQFYAELWNHSIGAPYLSKVACVIAFSDPLTPYMPEPPREEGND